MDRRAIACFAQALDDTGVQGAPPCVRRCWPTSPGPLPSAWPAYPKTAGRRARGPAGGALGLGADRQTLPRLDLSGGLKQRRRTMRLQPSRPAPSGAEVCPVPPGRTLAPRLALDAAPSPLGSQDVGFISSEIPTRLSHSARQQLLDARRISFGVDRGLKLEEGVGSLPHQGCIQQLPGLASQSDKSAQQHLDLPQEPGLAGCS